MGVQHMNRSLNDSLKKIVAKTTKKVINDAKPVSPLKNASKDPKASKAALRHGPSLRNTSSFDALKSAYDLKEDVTPRIVLHAMIDRVEAYAKIIYPIIQPEEFHSLHECTVFDDSDKQKIFELYKQLMILHRELLKIDIRNDASELNSLSKRHEELNSMRPELLRIVDKMQSAWKRDSKKGTVGYIS